MVLLKLIQINPGAQLDQIIGKLDLLAGQIESKLVLADPVEHTQANMDTPAPVPLVQSSPKEIAPKEMKPETPSLSMAADATALQTEEIQAPCAPAPPETEEAIPKTWPNFLKLIEKKLPSMFVLLAKGQVDASGPDALRVNLQECSAFDKSRLKTKRDALRLLCKDFLGKTLEITVVSETQSPGKPDKPKTVMTAAARNHPLVIDAQRLFDGEIIN